MTTSVETENARRIREQRRRKVVRADARDIAPFPAIVNPELRKSVSASFRLFCETYFPGQFTLAWSPDHLRVIAKIEQAVLAGGLFAMAMPRGSGKSTLAECAGLWAALCGHRRFPVIIGSDEGAAESMLDSIKTELETNDALLDDFPDAVFPIRALDGIAARASGQVYRGERTYLEWTAKQVVLATIPESPASGAIIRVAGITGRIRGMAFKRPDGKRVRPDLVIIDDPQTDESARSASQSQARLAVLTGAILGLAGPGKKIAGVMPCTVIAPGDMADRILDSKRHPEWNGERTKMVYAWPTNSKLWDEYATVRADCLRATGTIKAATEFYREHQAEMDAGARIAWPDRFNSDELSAIQNAMNLRLGDEAAFFAEYQNEPLPTITETDEAITPDLVLSRLSGAPQGLLPAWAVRVTAMIDVSEKALWWGVAAWDDSCDGAFIDYGCFPEQGIPYFTLRNLRVTLAHTFKGAGIEGQLTAGLDRLTTSMFARRFRSAAGAELGIERMLIDANWGEQTTTVYDFCRSSPHTAAILPSHGRGIGASALPMSEWAKKPGERAGHNWRIKSAKRGLRAIIYDTNHWKSFVASRLLTAPGDPGSLSIWGKDHERHRILADQLSAEHRIRTTGRGRTVDEWRLKPGRDNHWLDVLVGCAVAASVQGMPPAPSRRSTGPAGSATAGVGGAKADRMSFAALQRAARDRKP